MKTCSDKCITVNDIMANVLFSAVKITKYSSKNYFQISIFSIKPK